MAEYIERDVALKALCQVSAPTPPESHIVEKCIDKINDVPAAEVAPVVHGRWNKVEADLGGGIKTHRFACSGCGFLKNTLIGNYCPNCGAKMDLEKAFCQTMEGVDTPAVTTDK